MICPCLAYLKMIHFPCLDSKESEEEVPDVVVTIEINNKENNFETSSTYEQGSKKVSFSNVVYALLYPRKEEIKKLAEDILWQSIEESNEVKSEFKRELDAQIDPYYARSFLQEHDTFMNTYRNEFALRPVYQDLNKWIRDDLTLQEEALFEKIYEDEAPNSQIENERLESFLINELAQKKQSSNLSYSGRKPPACLCHILA